MKHNLVSLWRDDRWGDTEAKTDVVVAILDEAARWAASRGWSV